MMDDARLFVRTQATECRYPGYMPYARFLQEIGCHILKYSHLAILYEHIRSFRQIFVIQAPGGTDCKCLKIVLPPLYNNEHEKAFSLLKQFADPGDSIVA